MPPQSPQVLKPQLLQQSVILPAASAGAIDQPWLKYHAGENVEIFSSTQNAWVAGKVEQVFVAAGVAEGYSIAAGTVKVSSSAGVKWILASQNQTTLRKLQVPLTSVSKIMCKNCCGRSVQPGLSRGMKAYDTCCKSCAQFPGQSVHDNNCGGVRGSNVFSASGAEDLPGGSYKRFLDLLLTKEDAFSKYVEKIYYSAMTPPIPWPKVGDYVQKLMVPFQVVLEITEEWVVAAKKKHGKSDDMELSEFSSVCREVLQDRKDLWFPEILPVSTSDFVRRNDRPLEEVYKFGRKLGQGSFGSVYEVWHRVSGERRVCKKIARTQSSGMSQEQILAEIRNMAMLDHPNVIKIYEYFVHSEFISQIMEPCSGGELQDFIDSYVKTGERHYDEAFICDVLKQTLRALAFMHNMRFLHKDLKPQNIMLVAKGGSSVKVIDFGLAELFSANQQFAEYMGGTLLYMAPEVFREKMTVKADVWSMGVILYNLLTGTFPLMGTWPPPQGKDEDWWQQETMHKIKHDDPAPHPGLDEVSPACRDILMYMLCKDVKQRPDAAQCLEHPWFKGHNTVPPTLSVGVVQCVEVYARMPELKKGIFLIIAHECCVDALEELRAIFTHFDVRNKGSLSTADLRHVLAMSGLGGLRAERVGHALDRAGGGQIMWTDFISASICVSVCRKTAFVDAAFAAFDTDRDGKISMEDLVKVLADSSGPRRDAWVKVLMDEEFEMLATAEVRGGPAQEGRMKRSMQKFAQKVLPKETKVTRENFRGYMGQELDFQSGQALYPVH